MSSNMGSEQQKHPQIGDGKVEEAASAPLTLYKSPGEMMRTATEVAAACMDIVTSTAVQIQGKRYVCIEGWAACAVAHGCTLGARDVVRVPPTDNQMSGGYRAIGELRRLADGALLATAEGFVGDDEATWGKRPDYAKRAMAQTRAMSRVGRAAFAHIVVLMKRGLQTTPAEEVPREGFQEVSVAPPPQQEATTPRYKITEEGEYQTAILSVKAQTFKNKKTGKEGTFYAIHTSALGELGTFSETLAADAMDFAGTGEIVTLRARPNPRDPKYAPELLGIKRANP